MSPSRRNFPTLHVLAGLIWATSVAASAVVVARDGDHHGHAAPLLELNETQILQSHAPDPPSYWDHDFGSLDQNEATWRGLMILHILGMSFAFLVALPVGISLRAVRHPLHPLAVAVFSISAFLSTAAGTLYRKLTPNMYQGSSHGLGGNIVLGLVSLLYLFDALDVITRAFRFVADKEKRASWSIKSFWREVVLNRQAVPTMAEYQSLTVPYPDEYDEVKLQDDVEHLVHKPRSEDVEEPFSDQWVGHPETTERLPGQRSSMSSSHSDTYSEDTLHSPRQSTFHEGMTITPARSRLLKAARGFRNFVEYSLVILFFLQFLSGSAVYTGICRGNYVNGCLAHLIKGGIFWCFGLLTFGRYLGAYAGLGWAWNRVPSTSSPRISAELVESSVILFYGVTNTFMERFGAEPGSAYTTKQVQHISIAVMFATAGALGVALESRRVARWLSRRPEGEDSTDESGIRCNPFPAIVIGVTGAAMSAHHQTYQFQVQIHALWGFFLVAFAVLRCLTYFFVHIHPPRSETPSRPPTEALASFALACGGLAFIFSDEQITFAAMRHGHDDVMFFFNLTVAVTCLALCWVLFVTAVKGWTALRAQRPNPKNRVVFSSD